MLHQETDIFLLTYERFSSEKPKKKKCLIFLLNDILIINRGVVVKPNRVSEWNYKDLTKLPYEKLHDKDKKGKCFILEKDVVQNNKNVSLIYEIEVIFILMFSVKLEKIEMLY
jgi:hypothetical protein